MPAESKKQQIAMRIALAAKKDPKLVKNLKGASLQMYKSMSMKQLEDFAKGSVKPKSKLQHG
jgi:hypothetical protein